MKASPRGDINVAILNVSDKLTTFRELTKKRQLLALARCDTQSSCHDTLNTANLSNQTTDCHTRFLRLATSDCALTAIRCESKNSR